MAKHRGIMSGRSIVPCVFVISLAGLGVAAVFDTTARWLLAAELGVYLVAALVFGVLAVRRRQETFRLGPRVLAVFATFHVAHGLGMLHGGTRRLLHISL
jgi:hypothetical protein